MEDESRQGGLGVAPKWDWNMTSAEAKPVVLCFEDGCAAVLVVELDGACAR